MFSYWERKHFMHYDNVIIGAGLAGLFTAIQLKKKYPQQRVLVLDKERFPAASTKNAGFACMGSITELEDDLKHSNQDEIAQLFQKRYQGLQIMRNELGDENIAYKEKGSHELLYKKDLLVLDKIEYWNNLLFHIAGKKAFAIADLNEMNFNGFSGAIENTLEGEIDTGKMYYTLKMKAQSLGVEIEISSRVVSFEKEKKGYQVFVEGGYSLFTNRLILCTNAFTSKLLPTVNIAPARGQVVIVKPARVPNFKGVYHFESGYYYFREVDGLILFGGGRNLDEYTETTEIQGENELILQDLETKLSEQIIADMTFEILYSWSGIMGKSITKKPIAKQLDDNLFLLAGFGGMGVALAPYLAQELVSRV